MNSKIVKDLMIPLSEYATVSQEATLREAIASLKKAHEDFGKTKDRHRAVLIFNKDKKIIGKLSHLDILRAVKPKTKKIVDQEKLAEYGFDSQFIHSMISKYELWYNTVKEICAKKGNEKVKNFMYTISKSEYVKDDLSLDEAVHKLLLGQHQSLLVAKQDNIVGILRLTDVFSEIAQMIDVKNN